MNVDHARTSPGDAPGEHAERLRVPPRVVLDYLRDHDVLCSNCAYNLRGSLTARCPECGLDIDVRDIEHEHPGVVPDSLDEYLAVTDVRCKKCLYNLRNIKGGRCPECGTTYMLLTVPRLPPGSRLGASAEPSVTVPFVGICLVLLGGGGIIMLIRALAGRSPSSAWGLVASLVPISLCTAWWLGAKAIARWPRSLRLASGIVTTLLSFVALVVAGNA